MADNTPTQCNPVDCGNWYLRCGRESTYSGKKCRCDACRASNSKYHAALRLARRSDKRGTAGPCSESNCGDLQLKCGQPSTYTVRGCRCDDCKSAGTAFNRAYKVANREKVAVQKFMWRKENIEAVRSNDRKSRLTRRAREAAVDSVQFTSAELAQRMAYYGNRCYLRIPGLCTGAFDNVEHVKPISRNGPHMLANLRPACSPCNRRKWDQWPFPAANNN